MISSSWSMSLPGKRLMKAKPTVTLVSGRGGSGVAWSAGVASGGAEWIGPSTSIRRSAVVGGLALAGVVGGG